MKQSLQETPGNTANYHHQQSHQQKAYSLGCAFGMDKSANGWHQLLIVPASKQQSQHQASQGKQRYEETLPERAQYRNCKNYHYDPIGYCHDLPAIAPTFFQLAGGMLRSTF